MSSSSSSPPRPKYDPANRRPFDPEKHCGSGRGGKRCQLPRGWGTDHVGIGNCRIHLGTTISHRTRAKRLLAEVAVATYGLPRNIEPHVALLEEIYRTAGAVDYLELQVRAHTEDELIKAARPWLELYQHERAHLVAVCATAIKCGIAERQVHLAEQHGRLIAEVIGGVLKDLGHGDDPKVGAVVRRHLTLVGGKE